MLRVIMIAVSLLIIPATTSGLHASQCDEVSKLAAARLRMLAARHSRIDPAHAEDTCRAFRNDFYEAVVARQIASTCDDKDRERHLDLLDAQIETLNDVIAANCND